MISAMCWEGGEERARRERNDFTEFWELNMLQLKYDNTTMIINQLCCERSTTILNATVT